jgi:hypothetical protein
MSSQIARTNAKLLPSRSQRMKILSGLFLIILCALSASSDVAQSIANASALNKDLAAELLMMEAEDQKYRGVIETEAIKMSSAGTSKASAVFLTAVKSQDEIDKKNLVRLEEIVKENGWPGKSLVGDKASQAAFLVVQHSDLAHQEKYLPLLKAAATKGEARPADVAMLEDRVRVRQGKKQIYGTQIHSGPDTGGKMVLDPIEDEEHVDERRAAVGLMPLKEYLKHFGMEYLPPKRR